MWDGNWILHKCKEGYPEEYEPVWILLERVNKRGMKEVLGYYEGNGVWNIKENLEEWNIVSWHER